ncbi:SsgA family sporulation/cell division regulator [Nonomuraea sp. NPDC049646]|uniref:SsgA family sporulation/cell division regulator n=1 Tax=unclassified Nonomuraea TaxID=2593643 RepID=UPI00378BB234
MRKVAHRTLPLWDAACHDARPYNATLMYRADDPFAVEIILPVRDSRLAVGSRIFIYEPETGRETPALLISFGRALLIDGLEQPAGAGVVRIEPHIVDRDYTTLTLPFGGGSREFFAERRRLEEFIDATFRVVPLGGEIRIADRALNRWLGEVTA